MFSRSRAGSSAQRIYIIRDEKGIRLGSAKPTTVMFDSSLELAAK